MSRAYVTPEDLSAALEAFATHGSKQAAADALGIPVTTLKNRLMVSARERGQAAEAPAKPFEIEPLPDELPSADELIARRTKDFARKRRAKEARALVPIKVTIDGPFGIAHFGDPHVDDNGTDLALLKRHVEIVNSTEALFAANVGDIQNNWIGRLARLYGEQSLSARESWVLAEWLVKSVRWLYIVGGNHDAWSGAGDPLEWISRQATALYEMNGVRVGLECPNGRVIRINARHDFKGHSQFNTAHAVMKAAKLGWRDHVLTCGHKHTSGYGLEKDPSTGLISHCIRTASYKVYDRYAEQHGMLDQSIFICPVTIIDPQYADDDPRLITTIFDPEEGAEYLTWKRARRKKRAA